MVHLRRFFVLLPAFVVSSSLVDTTVSHEQIQQEFGFTWDPNGQTGFATPDHAMSLFARTPAENRGEEGLISFAWSTETMRALENFIHALGAAGKLSGGVDRVPLYVHVREDQHSGGLYQVPEDSFIPSIPSVSRTTILSRAEPEQLLAAGREQLFGFGTSDGRTGDCRGSSSDGRILCPFVDSQGERPTRTLRALTMNDTDLVVARTHDDRSTDTQQFVASLGENRARINRGEPLRRRRRAIPEHRDEPLRRRARVIPEQNPHADVPWENHSGLAMQCGHSCQHRHRAQLRAVPGTAQGAAAPGTAQVLFETDELRELRCTALCFVQEDLSRNLRERDLCALLTGAQQKIELRFLPATRPSPEDSLLRTIEAHPSTGIVATTRQWHYDFVKSAQKTTPAPHELRFVSTLFGPKTPMIKFGLPVQHVGFDERSPGVDMLVLEGAPAPGFLHPTDFLHRLPPGHNVIATGSVDGENFLHGFPTREDWAGHEQDVFRVQPQAEVHDEDTRTRMLGDHDDELSFHRISLVVDNVPVMRMPRRSLVEHVDAATGTSLVEHVHVATGTSLVEHVDAAIDDGPPPEPSTDPSSAFPAVPVDAQSARDQVVLSGKNKKVRFVRVFTPCSDDTVP